MKQYKTEEILSMDKLIKLFYPEENPLGIY